MRLCVYALLCMLCVSCATQTEPSGQRVTQIKNALSSKHPAAYFELAETLWQGGAQQDEAKRDEAVVMYYVGQIRYRAFLNTIPDAEAVAEERTYDALRTELGEELNQYAARDLDNWVSLIDRALEWHRKTPNEFLPKEEYSLLYEMVLFDFQRLREYIANNKALIRAQRAEQGLENR